MVFIGVLDLKAGKAGRKFPLPYVLPRQFKEAFGPPFLLLTVDSQSDVRPTIKKTGGPEVPTRTPILEVKGQLPARLFCYQQ